MKILTNSQGKPLMNQQGKVYKAPPVEAPENDVNFYDYDGFRVASFTIAEAKALTQAEYNAILPPTHEGLTFQEWNWTLSDITSYNRRYIDIGANYITTDGKTHIKGYVSSVAEDVIMSFNGQYGTLEVDWGDGSSSDSQTFTSAVDKSFTHTYSATGDYEIRCTFTQSSGTGKFGTVNRGYLGRWSGNFIISEINCGSYFTLEKTDSVSYIPNLAISISTSTIFNVYTAFKSTHCCLVVPRSVSKVANYNAFVSISGKVCFPSTIPDQVALSLQSYTGSRLVFPECITLNESIARYGFQSMKYLDVLSIPTTFNIPANDILSLCSDLRVIDIPQGFVLSGSLRLDYSYRLGVQNTVDFFNKLGTTTGTITITLTTGLINSLTEDQKAIATNKGYTLASA